MMCALPTAGSLARASGAAALLGTLLLLVAACGGVESPASNGGSLADRVGETAAAQPERDSAADGAQQQVSSDRDEPLPAASVVPTPRPLPQRRFEVPPAPKVVLAEDTPPLHRAAFDGDLEAVRELLEQGEYVDGEHEIIANTSFRTPLHLAVMNNHVAVVELLLEWDATIAYHHFSASAVYNDDPAMIALLLERWGEDTDVDRLLYALRTAAATSDNPAVVEALLESGVDINGRTQRGTNTALHEAAQHNPNPAITQLLLKRGANINAYATYGAYPQGWTALHLAVGWNPEPAVTEVLLHWAEDAHLLYGLVDALNTCCNSTPLHYAGRNPNGVSGADIAGLLLDYGADIEAERQEKATPLIEATEHHSHEVIEVLLDRGADISVTSNMPGGLDLSLLHVAVAYGPDMVEEGDYWADEWREHWQRKRLTLAEAEAVNRKNLDRRIATLRLLLDRGLDVDTRDGSGRTPLLLAMWAGSLASDYPYYAGLLEFLLEQGANPRFKDKEGATPCSKAAASMAHWTESGREGRWPLSKPFEERCE